MTGNARKHKRCERQPRGVSRTRVCHTCTSTTLSCSTAHKPLCFDHLDHPLLRPLLDTCVLYIYSGLFDPLRHLAKSIARDTWGTTDTRGTTGATDPTGATDATDATDTNARITEKALAATTLGQQLIEDR